MSVSRASCFIREWLDAGTRDDPHTQEILAERLSPVVGRPVSQSTVSNIKTGKSTPKIDLIEAFRVVLGIQPSWWLPDAPPQSTPSLADAEGRRRVKRKAA